MDEESAIGLRLDGIESDLKSLIDTDTKTRHEHAGWLNRLTLEINELRLRSGEVQAARITALEGGVRLISEKYDALSKIVGDIASDMKTLSWKVGVIIGVIVFLAQWATKFIHV
jgi:hypothetical protein